ncbi:DUF397 domain-containing protein [Crossiella equi]|uniref:DUF397 domain-containing protein n=1 Tax=Crossiella equi TaxID=130796 RepID=UPI0023EA6CBC|nr:DUF397 domain-containing protein [Crossiella equi]
MEPRKSAVVVEVDSSGLVWRKSSRSNDTGGNCVEVTTSAPAGVVVRTSRDRAGDRLAFSTAGWSAFLHDVVSGRIPSRG